MDNRQVAAKVNKGSNALLQGVLALWMFCMLVILPLYATDGYKNIGVDKANLFCKVSLVLIPAALLLLAVRSFSQILLPGEQLRDRKTSDMKNPIDEGPQDTFLQKNDGERRSCGMEVYWGLGFLVAVLLSYGFTPYKGTALWGMDEWYMGTLPMVFAVTGFLLIALAWEGRGVSKYVPLLAFPVLLYVFFAGYLNRFAIFWGSFEVEDRVRLSTIGNINWYCGYIVIPIALVMGWFFVKKNYSVKEKVAGWMFLLLGFLTLTTQGSDSGYLCFGIVWLVLWGLSAKTEDFKRIWSLLLLFAVACDITFIIRITGMGEPNYTEAMENLMTRSAAPVFLTVLSGIMLYAYMHPQDYSVAEWSEKNHKKLVRVLGVTGASLGLVFVALLWINTSCGGKLSDFFGLSEDNFLFFNDKWGTFRSTIWKIAGTMFLEASPMQKLWGVGPDCFYEGMQALNIPSLVEELQSNVGGQLLTNAHCEYLNLLCTVGIVGTLLFAAMMISAVLRFCRAGWNGNAVAFSCGIALVAYTVNNLVSFQQTMNVVTMFIVMGLGEWSINWHERAEDY